MGGDNLTPREDQFMASRAERLRDGRRLRPPRSPRALAVIPAITRPLGPTHRGVHGARRVIPPSSLSWPPRRVPFRYAAVRPRGVSSDGPAC